MDVAWDDYFVYGGLPLILSMKTPGQKADYLTNLLGSVYLSDIIERHRIRNRVELDELVDVLSSAIGSPTNPFKLSKTIKSVRNKVVSDKTINNYIGYLIDAFLISKASRFDVKRRKYIGSPSKYYFEDVGLRNARLNFRQTEENHIMENIIHNELRVRGYRVDVGVVNHVAANGDGARSKRQLEVDFVATKGSEKHYVQSAFSIGDPDKAAQEERPLKSIGDSFKKIVVVRDNIKARRNEDGIVTIGICNFLLDENSLNL
jgi:predicted AAA+ superfamily ATPase